MNHVAHHEATLLGFETKRLQIRPLQAEDEALYCGLYANADTMRFIGKPLSSERVARSFHKVLASASKQPPEHVFLTILDKATQLPLGICAIVQFDATMSRAEVGMMLKSEARSQGYAKECLPGLVTEAFAVFPIDEVWVQYSPGHSVAERLVASIGFSLRADLAPDEDGCLKCTWSVHRPSWGSINAINNQGKTNVERHRLS
jgi:RimJ/RimL family protein N-acetyltransferase